MSVDSDRRPRRFATDDTVYTRLSVAQDASRSPSRNSDDDEKRPRFSINQPSVKETVHNRAPRRRQSKAPNIKASRNSGLPPGAYEKDPRQSDDAHEHGDSWRKCHKLVEKYDDELCEAWKAEVDNILIFAGLFSAAVTAFVVESYQWLQEGSDDVSAQLLAFIANQLANSTTPVPPNLLQQGSFSVTASQVRINTVWFLSLTLSLSTVLVGILCLQWLREYQRDATLSHKDAVALRQMRYEGLLFWKVPDILSLLPILLSTSLVLFFFGLLELLWTRNVIVAAFVTASVGGVMFFLGATTILPAVQYLITHDAHLRVPQCPYKSPQSWLFYRIGSVFFFVLDYFNIWNRWANFDEDPSTRRLSRSQGDLSWLMYDIRWRQLRDAQEVTRGRPKNMTDRDDIVRGLQWLNTTFKQNVEAVHSIQHAIADLELPAASATVSGFFLDGQIDKATLRVMLDDFSPTESQKRDILSAYYLNIHQSSHPALKITYVETVLRILNAQDVPAPFYDRLSEILQELTSASQSSLQVSSKHPLLNPECIAKVLSCVKNIMRRRRGLQTSHIVDTWALINRLLTPSFASIQEENSDTSISSDTDVGTVNTYHLKLACSIFEELEVWIESGSEMERWERVKLCSEGMLTVFSATPDILYLQNLCPEMGKAVSLMRTLQEQLENMGGAKVVLAHSGRWWMAYWEGYHEGDWERLMEIFREANGVAE